MRKKFFLLVSILCLGMANVMAQELDLSTLVTASSSVTYEFTNDIQYPWELSGGVLSSNNQGHHGSQSYCQFDVTCTEDTYCFFNYFCSTEGGCDRLHVIIDGIEDQYSGSDNGSYSRSLSAGNHILRFGYTKDGSVNSGEDRVWISNLKFGTLDELISVINLSVAGDLGLEAVSNGGTLSDFTHIKVTGPMNSADWSTISNMTNLVYVDLEETSVTDIPDNAFSNNNIQVVKFPANLKTIGYRAFYNRSRLNGDLSFPATLESIGNQAFYGCSSLTSVTLPASLTSLGTEVFKKCSSIVTATFNNDITAVPSYTFHECGNLTSVYGLGSVKEAGSSAFSECYKLANIEGLKLEKTNEYAFYNCYVLTDFDFSELRDLGRYSFANNRAITNLSLPKLETLNSNGYQFQGCTGLESVVLPDRITAVPYAAFQNCSNLKNVTLGASLTSIANYAFTGTALEKLYVNAPVPPTTGNSFSDYSSTLYVPSYSMVSYKLSEYWKNWTSFEVNTNEVSEVTIAGALTLTSGARIPNSPKVDVLTTGSLVVNGTLEQPIGEFIGHFTDGNNAVLLSRCPAMTSTASEVRYWMNTGYWYFVCVPFDVKVSSITSTVGAQIAIRYYDGESRATNGTGASWKDVPADGTLEAGKGYIFRVSVTNGEVCLPATADTRNNIFTNAAVVTTLETHATEVSADKNWNLVGNPYTAYYDIYRMDYTAPITVWNVNNRTYTAYSIADDNLALMPLQAFFVQKPDLVPSITFQPEGRQLTSTVEHEAAAKSNAQSLRKVVNVTLTDGETTDMTRVVVNPQATDAFDAENDATKMMSFDGTPQIYSMVDGEMFSINEGQQAKGLVELGMWFPESGEFTIDLSRADTDVELLDNGVVVAMPYTFNASGDYCEGRFALRIGGIVNSLETINAQKADNSIYNIAGQKVENLQKGIYIVNGKKVMK